MCSRLAEVALEGVNLPSNTAKQHWYYPVFTLQVKGPCCQLFFALNACLWFLDVTRQVCLLFSHSLKETNFNSSLCCRSHSSRCSNCVQIRLKAIQFAAKGSERIACLGAVAARTHFFQVKC